MPFRMFMKQNKSYVSELDLLLRELEARYPNNSPSQIQEQAKQLQVEALRDAYKDKA